MEGIIAIIIIVFALVTASKKNTKKPNGRGGTAQTAQKVVPPAAPAPARPQPVRNKPKPAAEKKPAHAEPVAAVTPGHEAAPENLAQGESRECEHGSVGGSIEITQHEGEEGPKKNESVKPAERLARPAARVAAFSVQDMQRAVVMSEILTRPAQRRRRY